MSFWRSSSCFMESMKGSSLEFARRPADFFLHLTSAANAVNAVVLSAKYCLNCASGSGGARLARSSSLAVKSSMAVWSAAVIERSSSSCWSCEIKDDFRLDAVEFLSPPGTVFLSPLDPFMFLVFFAFGFTTALGAALGLAEAEENRSLKNPKTLAVFCSLSSDEDGFCESSPSQSADPAADPFFTLLVGNSCRDRGSLNSLQY